MRYPVVIHKDPESYYGVTIPDLPGCFSAGDTVEDALTQVVEAIECYLEGLVLDSEPIPNPKDITFHTNNPDYADGLWETVSVLQVDKMLRQDGFEFTHARGSHHHYKHPDTGKRVVVP